MTDINLEMIYIVVSMLVALGIGIQSYALYKNQGRIPESSFVALLSFLDMIWFVVTVVALWWLEFDGLFISVPVVYIIYTILSFFYAARNIDVDKVERPKDVVFSTKYLNFNASFAVVFLSWCGYVLFGV